MKGKNKTLLVNEPVHAREQGEGHAEVKNPISQAFAHRFRQWRREQNMTMKQVAADLGLSVAIISEWEHCNRFPTVKTLQSVVEYTGVPAWAFLHPGIKDGVNPASAKGKSKRVRRQLS